MLSVIVNPSAGGGRALRALHAVGAELARHDVEHEVLQTTSLEHARELALAAAANGATPVAFGGDGLVAAVAGALAATDHPVGVLPGGRGNDFARCLGLPLDPVDACETLAFGTTMEVDLGVAGDTTFVGIATCGFDAEANRIANATRLPLGRLVYAYGALRALASWRAMDFNLSLDGHEHSFTGYSVAVANSSRYGGGMQMAPAALLDDGFFDVVLVSAAPKPVFVAQLPLVFSGRHVNSTHVTVVRAREVEVESTHPSPMYADGDPVAQLPVKLRVLPRSLRVMVPRR